MGSRRFASILIFLVAIVLFLAGLVHFFALRFETGSFYPPYSSYRSDPLGTRAFYEGLARLPGIESVRNTDALRSRPGMNQAALLLIGVTKEGFRSMDLPTVEAIERTAQAGGRVVLALAPDKGVPHSEGSASSEGAAGGETANRKEQGPEKKGSPEAYVDLGSRWHLGFKVLREQDGQARLATKGRGLPPSVDWRSGVAFEPGDGEWRTIYSREDAPVVVERSMGRGTVVLLSDASLMSNQAMKERRYPALLSWFCGSHKKIVFDETHFGISDRPGIAALLRKEGLAPLFLSLILLVLLAVWNQSARFVPPVDRMEAEAANPGRTYQSGMAGLLRQNVRPDDLLAVCLDEWEKSFTRAPGGLASLGSDIEEIMKEERDRPGRTRSPVDGYNRISALIAARQRGAKKRLDNARTK